MKFTVESGKNRASRVLTLEEVCSCFSGRVYRPLLQSALLESVTVWDGDGQRSMIKEAVCHENL